MEEPSTEPISTPSDDNVHVARDDNKITSPLDFRISREFDHIERMFGPLIQSATATSIALNLKRSRTKQIVIKLHVELEEESVPSKPLESKAEDAPLDKIDNNQADDEDLSLSRVKVCHVNLSTGVMDEEAVLILTRAAEKAIVSALKHPKAHADDVKAMPAFGAIAAVVSSIQKHAFLGCLDEIRQVLFAMQQQPTESKKKKKQNTEPPKQLASLLEDVDDGLVKLNSKKGTIKLRFPHDEYPITVTIRISDVYPDESPAFTIKGFDDRIVTAYDDLAKRLLLQLIRGIPADTAFKQVDKSLLETHDKHREANSITINVQHLASVKRDVSMLKTISDLRAESGIKYQRKALRKLARTELANIDAEEEQKRKEEQERVAAINRSFMYGDAELSVLPLPSVLPLVLFFQKTIAALPTMTCQVCEKPMLPTKLVKLKKMKPQSKLYPMMATCHDWFHYACLDKALTEPPFGKDCAVCGQTISHGMWTSDLRSLEKAWAMKQARKREISDVYDMFG